MPALEPTSGNSNRPFLPAKPAGWLISATQAIVRAQLAINNKLELPEVQLDALRKIPSGAGVVLTSNHADETDPRVCLELSRRSGRRFISMCNREAFDESFGLAGWALQRLGHFSVERGAHDAPAKHFAIEVMRQGKDVLVIFPEGEIFYLNEEIQSFHSGAVEIAMQAIVENRRTNPDWTAYIVPMAIKYHYSRPVDAVLEKRIAKMESILSLPAGGQSLPERIRAIQRALIEREEAQHQIDFGESRPQDLTQEIVATRDAILSEVEQKHTEMPVSHGHPLDESWQLAAEMRESLAQQQEGANPREILKDIGDLTEVAQLSSWRPHYYSENSSPDRLAEGVLKLERELYRIKRPRQLASRSVLVTIAEPIDLGQYVLEYQADAHSIRHRVTAHLQSLIQSMVDALAAGGTAV